MLKRRHTLARRSAVALVIITTSFLLVYVFRDSLFRKASVPIEGDITELVGKLGLNDDDWLNYDKEHEQHLGAFEIDSVKIMFELKRDHPHILVLKKKAKRSRSKHKKWEFPGGRIDGGESVLTSLERELIEEDPSGILVRAFQIAKAEREKLLYKILTLKNRKIQALFKSPISEKDWQDLELYWAKNPRNKEVYSYYLLPMQELDFSKDKQLWTPKSRAILEALRS
ncbi:MAG: NUDIX domain-containing protein [Deltaproteobacteria bacterium]|nr:NUDIX domain-containing protein [Deltaproteobacteria bacterium]